MYDVRSLLTSLQGREGSEEVELGMSKTNGTWNRQWQWRKHECLVWGPTPVDRNMPDEGPRPTSTPETCCR